MESILNKKKKKIFIFGGEKLAQKSLLLKPLLKKGWIKRGKFFFFKTFSFFGNFLQSLKNFPKK